MPWGDLRATLALRGIKAPPRHSVQEAILIEALLRERTEDFVKQEVMIMSALSSAPREVMTSNFHKELSRIIRRQIFRSVYNVQALRFEREQLEKMMHSVEEL